MYFPSFDSFEKLNNIATSPLWACAIPSIVSEPPDGIRNTLNPSLRNLKNNNCAAEDDAFFA